MIAQEPVHQGQPERSADEESSTGRRASPDEVPWQTHEDLLVLHAVRLAGFANSQGIAARAHLDVDVVERVLGDLHRAGLTEVFAFADTSGWILTEAGMACDATWLAEELDASQMRPLLEATTERFEVVNARLVEVVTAWQLRPPATDTGHETELLDELRRIATTLDNLTNVAAHRLPRLGRYSRQFRAALDRACVGELEWIAGVGRLSCHTVWAELHQDLLSSLGRDRSAGSPRRP